MPDLQALLQRNYEQKLISAGDNFPGVNLREGNLDWICIMLHHRIPLPMIQSHFGWSTTELEQWLLVLEVEGLIKRTGKGYAPTCMVISQQEGQLLYDHSRPLIEQTVAVIQRHLEAIKHRTMEFACFRSFQWEELTLLILSGVLLDFIQIDHVEREVLQARRTRRNQKEYYLAYLENDAPHESEAFGIYGNEIKSYGDVWFCTYGNNRQNHPFHNYQIDSQDPTKTKTLIPHLLHQLLKLHEGEIISPQEIHELQALGLVHKEFGGSVETATRHVALPILTEADVEALQEIAAIISTDLIDLLRSAKPALYKNYTMSSYAGEISFAEFYMWWYHFYYTMVTDALIKQNIILPPQSGNFSYLITTAPVAV